MPTIVTTMIVLDPPSMQIVFQAGLINAGSPVTRYRVYQSQTLKFTEKYLAIDAATADIECNNGNMTLTVLNPTTALSYYFKVAACNLKGESKYSEASSETIIDYPPEKPTKPVVKKLSATSIHISTADVPDLGSSPSRFKVTMVRIIKGGNGETRTESYFTVPAVVNLHGRKEMHYNVEDVERGSTYKFSVSSFNSTGQSEESDWSDEIDIGM